MRKMFLLFIILVWVATVAPAQQVSSRKHKSEYDDLGWTSSMSFEGNVDSSQRVFTLNSSIGYNFTKHWGADVGVPFEFVTSSTPASTSTAATSATGRSASINGGSSTSTATSSLDSIGNIFADLRFGAKGTFANYTSSLVASLPTGSRVNGISTGRVTSAWNNHLEHDFGLLTPFIEAGVGNSVTDTPLYHRPFTTLGFVSQFTGGTSFDLGHDLSVGASLYDVLPSGQQKIYSKLVGRGSSQAAGKGDHGRTFELEAETVGTSTLARDNGNSAWVDYSPGPFDLQAGYTHSVHYAENTLAFSMGANLGRLMKRTAHY